MRRLLVIAALLVALPAGAVTAEWLYVGEPGNAPDTATNCYAANCGSVAYGYYISKYEVTNGQYRVFLNAKASSDPLGLYNPSMGSDATFGGITRSGSPGSYTYAIKPGFWYKPVAYVSFYDALRFVNWLQNGQGSADTETGAYTITPAGIANNSITRNASAAVFLPSENEWYKAAYYDPWLPGYYDYPVGSDVAPGCVAPASDTGNSANCNYAVGALTDVGAYALSVSPYGTFDQGGNLWEWNEQIVFGTQRGDRGGSWDNPSIVPASFPFSFGPTAENQFGGFRVASRAPTTVFDGGGAYSFNGATDSGVLVTGNSTLDIIAPASLTEPGAACAPRGTGALCVGTSDLPGYVNVRSGSVESAVLSNGYIGVLDGSVGWIYVLPYQYTNEVHVLGGGIGSIYGDYDSHTVFRVFDGAVGPVTLWNGHVEISGGRVGSLSIGGCCSSVSIDIHGGEVAGGLNLFEGIVRIDGGTFVGPENVLTVDYFSPIFLSGGVFESGAEFRLQEGSWLDVTGTGLALSEPEYVGDDHLDADYRSTLTGRLLDGNPISVDVFYNPTYPLLGAVRLHNIAECANGFDDDGDALIDHPADTGCASAEDLSEHDPNRPCDDGADNDGDGQTDYLAAGGGDPGCASPTSARENPQCQDGLNNDNATGIDFDGGASLDIDPQDNHIDIEFNPATPPVGAADPQCVGKPSKDKEASGGCGLGFELVLLAPLLSRLTRRRRAKALPDGGFGRRHARS